MKNLTILIIAILFIQNANSQNSLSGYINDKSNELVFFATVVLYNNSDSTISQATSSNNEGTYKLENIKDGDYYLEVSYVGYHKERKPFKIKKVFVGFKWNKYFCFKTK